MKPSILRAGAKAEQVGQELAADTLDAMRQKGSNDAAAFLLAEALRDLAELPRRDRAAEGFAAEIVAPLRAGLFAAPGEGQQATQAHCFELQGEFWWGDNWTHDVSTVITHRSASTDSNAPVTVHMMAGCSPRQGAELLREMARMLESKGYTLPSLAPLETPGCTDGEGWSF